MPPFFISPTVLDSLYGQKAVPIQACAWHVIPSDISHPHEGRDDAPLDLVEGDDGGRSYRRRRGHRIPAIHPVQGDRPRHIIKAAEEAGYDVLIIDSMTHEWSGSGGCLELVDQIAKARFRGNTWSAWSEVTPRHRKFVDAMLQSKCHIIATMRSKTETVQTENEKGRKTVQKLGMKAEQRDGMDYEFTVVFDINQDHIANASKDRTAMFSDPVKIDENVGKKISAWLSSAKTMETSNKTEVSAATVEVLLKGIENSATLEDLKFAANQIKEIGVTGEARERLMQAYKTAKAKIEQQ